MKPYIYADNAATTRLAPVAFEAMKPFLLENYANASQPYSFARPAKKALKEARITIADCIGAKPEEIFFTSGGTESDNWAIKCIGDCGNDNNLIITSSIEHHAILNACSAINNINNRIEYLAVDNLGVADVSALKKLCVNNPKLVSVMMANNEIGSIQPVKNLATCAHEYGALFHTDAVQAVGHIDINVKHLGVDLLSASAHKFNGPKGVGFLYIKEGTNIKAFNDGGAQEFGLRAGTENVAGIIGMAAALRYNIDNLPVKTKELKKLEEIMISILTEAKLDFVINGSNNKLPGNISISFPNLEGEMLLHRLDLKGICVSTGSACDSQNTQISHVLKAINLPYEYAKGTIRISLGNGNTESDAKQIAESLIKIIKN